jgi:hypothetical protein
MRIDGFSDSVRDEIAKQWEAAKKDAFNTGLEPDIVADFIIAVVLIYPQTVALTIDGKGGRSGKKVYQPFLRKRHPFSTPEQLVTDVVRELDSIQSGGAQTNA